MRRPVHGLAAVIAAALIGGCAGPVPVAAPPELFDDAAFRAPAVPVSAESVFALDDGMRRFIDEEINRQARTLGVQRALGEALIKPGRLRIEYDATMTRNAAEAFDARSGNCLSLVLMTAAFAKALDLRVEYHSANQEESWSRRGNLLVVSGHVNISLGRRPLDVGARNHERVLTIDFLPPADASSLRTQPIDESTIVAMYFNNRAAEALLAERLDEAYAFARTAVRTDPRFLAAYNTLGLVYRRHGQDALAARTFAHVLARDAQQRLAMANLADALDALDRREEASRWRQQLARLEPFAPFHFLELGRSAAARGDWAEARRQFERELARNEYSAEIHHWLALAHWHLGDAAATRKHLALAVENSTTGGDRALYAAKLAWINTVRRQ